ncbi:Hypothetical protein FKW44_009470, partial [Caligus rogercresseyi]
NCMMEFKSAQTVSVTEPFNPVAVNQCPNLFERIVPRITDLNSGVQYQDETFTFSSALNNEDWNTLSGLSVIRRDTYPIFRPANIDLATATRYRLVSPIVRRNYMDEIRAAYYHGETVDSKSVSAFLIQSFSFSEVYMLKVK